MIEQITYKNQEIKLKNLVMLYGYNDYAINKIIEDIKSNNTITEYKYSNNKLIDNIKHYETTHIKSSLKHQDADNDIFIDNFLLWLKDMDIDYEKDKNTSKYLSVSPILLNILSATENEVLIFNNPEGFMHNSYRSILGKLFSLTAESGIQVIINTKCDIIINSIRANIAYGNIKHTRVTCLFFNKENEISEIKISSKAKIDNYPAGFIDEQDVLFDKIIWGF